MCVFSCDAATCAMTPWPRCWLWQTSTPTVKSWCLKLVLASCWDPSWREWEVRQSWDIFCGIEMMSFFHSVPFLYNYPLFPPHAGFGSVIQMYPGGGPVRAGVESFGFPAHFHDMLHEFPICHLNALIAGTLDTTAKDPSAGRVIYIPVIYWKIYSAFCIIVLCSCFTDKLHTD